MRLYSTVLSIIKTGRPSLNEEGGGHTLMHEVQVTGVFLNEIKATTNEDVRSINYAAIHCSDTLLTNDRDTWLTLGIMETINRRRSHV
jgi:hypothetical protein